MESAPTGALPLRAFVEKTEFGKGGHDVLDPHARLLRHVNDYWPAVKTFFETDILSHQIHDC